MIYNFIITALLIGAFFMCIKAYCIGFKHGKQVSTNTIPDININPIKPMIKLVNNIADKKEADKQQVAMNQIFNYNADTAMDAIKKERR